MGAFRLVATDLDGTILRPDLSISDRVSAAIDLVAAAGAWFVPVTARTPVGLQLVPPKLRTDGWAVFGNGCLAAHLATGQVLFEDEIPVAVLDRIVTHLSAEASGVEFACVRGAGRLFAGSPGYAKLARFTDHGRDPLAMQVLPIDELIAKPAAKLIARHVTLSPPELLAKLAPITGFEATFSGAPFVEIQASGVTKASGLARLCAHLGVAQHEVVAFGDADNDVDMLAWAGHGVAVANAVATTRAAADEVTASVFEDGVATVLERLFGDR